MRISILLSYVETLLQMAEGKLTDEDLLNSVFCFNVPRQWIMGWPTSALLVKYYGQMRVQVPNTTIHRFRAAIIEAESEHRVVWPLLLMRDRRAPAVHDQLNDALERVGLRTIPYDEHIMNDENIKGLAVSLLEANPHGCDPEREMYIVSGL